MKPRPEDPETHYNYALMLKAKGDEVEGTAQFRTAAELAPEVTAFRLAVDLPTKE